VSGVVIGETVRRHVTSVAFGSFIALLAIVAFGVAAMGGERMWPGLVALLAIIIGASVVGPEFSSGTLQLILVKPVNRAVYLVSRAAGVVAVAWMAGGLAAVCEIAGRATEGTPDLRMIGVALVNTFGDAFLIVALLALFGSFTRAYYNVVLYFGMQLFLAVVLGAGARKLPVSVISAINWIQRNVFPDAPPRFDRDWLLLVACNGAIALLLACVVFRNREVPYGAD
jgi:hypothetical protein